MILIFGYFFIIFFIVFYFQFNIGFLENEVVFFYVIGGVMMVVCMFFFGCLVDCFGYVIIFIIVSVGVLFFIYVIINFL